VKVVYGVAFRILPKISTAWREASRPPHCGRLRAP